MEQENIQKSTPENTLNSAPENEMRLNPSDNIALWVLLCSAFVVILNETVMGVALPVLLEELHITAVQGQWLTTAFMLTMSVVIPITGTLIQRLTTRQLYFTAMVFFLLGTIVCAAAPGFEVLLVGRVIQAVGTAITMPLMMTTLVTVVPPAMRGQVMGRVSLVISMAPALGPTISGLILQVFSWRFLFIVMLPIIVIAIGLSVKFLRDVGQSRKAPIDAVSVLLSLIGFGGLVYGLSAIGESGHGGDAAGSALPPLVPLVVGIIGVALFIWRQIALIKDEMPLLDLRVFTYKPYWVGAMVLGVGMMAMFGTIVLLPIYTANVLGMSTLQTGLLLLPGGLIMGLLGPVVGRLVDRIGTRATLVPGIAIVAASLWLFTLFGADTNYWFVQVVHLLFSIGLTLVFTPVFSAALGSLPHTLASHGSATISTLQQLCGAAGIALFVTVFSVATATAGTNDQVLDLAAGMHSAFVLAAVLATLMVPLALLMPKSSGNSHGAPPNH